MHYPVSNRDRLYSLFEQGYNVSRAAEKLKVSHGNVMWHYRNWQITQREAQIAAREAAKAPELGEYARFHNPIHVALLGDPPVHRSALWGRLDG